jgi:hypothetical protein
MLYELMDAFGAEFNEFVHLFVLSRNGCTFLLNFAIASRTKSRIMADFTSTVDLPLRMAVLTFLSSS